MLLAFVPFIAFAVLDRLISPTVGLVAGAVVAAALLVRDAVLVGHAPKILEVGTVLLFGGLALFAILGDATWSIGGVRLCVDAGLLAIVLVSMAVGRPFTLQYAREQVDLQHWDSIAFKRTNYVITAAWAAAFLVLVLADLLLLYRPDIHPRYGIIATVLALVAAFKFTAWYPEQSRAALTPSLDGR